MARDELVGACALIGALGGALFGFVFARSGTDWQYWQWGLVLTLTVCTTISATLLGLFLARRGGGVSVAGGRAAWASFVAGGFNGVLMALAMTLTKGSPAHAGLIELTIAAAIFGTVCAIPFAPAIIVATTTAAATDTRPQSIAARSQGRRVLRNAMVCLAAAGVCVTPDRRAPLAAHLPAYVMTIALAAAIGLLVIDAVVRRALRPDDHAWEPAAEGMTADRTLDYGIGLELLMRRAHDETYRAGVRATELRRGNADRARAIVEGSMRGHAIAAFAVAAALIVTISAR